MERANERRAMTMMRPFALAALLEEMLAGQDDKALVAALDLDLLWIETGQFAQRRQGSLAISH